MLGGYLGLGVSIPFDLLFMEEGGLVCKARDEGFQVVDGA